jgi:predicted NAD/FAD-binding protein
VWSSWNYIGTRGGDEDGAAISYWMNRLQNIRSETQLIVTLNPARPPRAGTIFHSEIYEHPLYDAAALAAQRRLWSLQGQNGHGSVAPIRVLPVSGRGAAPTLAAAPTQIALSRVLIAARS